MTLQESEEKISEINTEINKLLKEREVILKEWYVVFNSENTEAIVCIDENIGDNHNLYLVNGGLKIHVCLFDSYNMKSSIEEFYKRLDTSMCILNVANGRSDTPKYQKNLIYAKAIEIRENYINRVIKQSV